MHSSAVKTIRYTRMLVASTKCNLGTLFEAENTVCSKNFISGSCPITPSVEQKLKLTHGGWKG
jgi:hypothetical protein